MQQHAHKQAHIYAAICTHRNTQTCSHTHTYTHPYILFSTSFHYVLSLETKKKSEYSVIALLSSRIPDISHKARLPVSVCSKVIGWFMRKHASSAVLRSQSMGHLYKLPALAKAGGSRR